MSINPESIYVLEWSPRQKAFHIQTLGDSLRSTQCAFSTNTKLDWMILCLFESHEDARAGAEKFRASLCAGALELIEI